MKSGIPNPSRKSKLNPNRKSVCQSHHSTCKRTQRAGAQSVAKLLALVPCAIQRIKTVCHIMTRLSRQNRDCGATIFFRRCIPVPSRIYCWNCAASIRKRKRRACCGRRSATAAARGNTTPGGRAEQIRLWRVFCAVSAQRAEGQRRICRPRARAVGGHRLRRRSAAAIQRARKTARLRSEIRRSSSIRAVGGTRIGCWIRRSCLQDDAARQQIANILHGLFAAVGGDPEYAKSVASLMRLPDSVNTKPERGGVVAVITEFHPDRRYPLAAFEWLAVKPGGSNGKMPIVHLGMVTRRCRRSRWIICLSGASNGNRNRALFDAACQFRDAGYSQAEAEAQLDSAPRGGR